MAAVPGVVERGSYLMKAAVALTASKAAAAPGKRTASGGPCHRRPHSAAAAVKGTECARRRGAVRAALAGGGCCSNGHPPVPPPEALDEWMTFSFEEIVRDVGETPLLVHIYDRRRERRPRLEKEKAKAGSWPRIVQRWKDGYPVPDGMILVEQLHARNSDISSPASNAGSDSDQPVSKEGSKIWGVLVQGRGLECAACYLLKTDTVKSTMGYCTYFRLARASCFGEDAVLQLRNSWLVELTAPFPGSNGSNNNGHDHGH